MSEPPALGGGRAYSTHALTFSDPRDYFEIQIADIVAPVHPAYLGEGKRDGVYKRMGKAHVFAGRGQLTKILVKPV